MVEISPYDGADLGRAGAEFAHQPAVCAASSAAEPGERGRAGDLPADLGQPTSRVPAPPPRRWRRCPTPARRRRPPSRRGPRSRSRWRSSHGRWPAARSRRSAPRRDPAHRRLEAARQFAHRRLALRLGSGPGELVPRLRGRGCGRVSLNTPTAPAIRPISRSRRPAPSTATAEVAAGEARHRGGHPADRPDDAGLEQADPRDRAGQDRQEAGHRRSTGPRAPAVSASPPLRQQAALHRGDLRRLDPQGVHRRLAGTAGLHPTGLGCVAGSRIRAISRWRRRRANCLARPSRAARRSSWPDCRRRGAGSRTSPARRRRRPGDTDRGRSPLRRSDSAQSGLLVHHLGDDPIDLPEDLVGVVRPVRGLLDRGEVPQHQAGCREAGDADEPGQRPTLTAIFRLRWGRSCRTRKPSGKLTPAKTSGIKKGLPASPRSRLEPPNLVQKASALPR